MNQGATSIVFDEDEVINELKHYLPAQAPLKDFIHHNTLHAFQDLTFHNAIAKASTIFGYNGYYSLEKYRSLYASHKINHQQLEQIIKNKKGNDSFSEWENKILFKKYNHSISPRIGTLRLHWKKYSKIDMDSLVHPFLFRILCSYLDQGISIWNFPVFQQGLLYSIKELEKNSLVSNFKSKRVKNLIQTDNYDLNSLLEIVVGEESLYTQYLFDQQFAHQGWSGMVSTIEDQPHTLVDPRKISLKELIILELLLEIDLLDSKFGEDWKPLFFYVKSKPIDLFEKTKPTELDEVLSIFQEAFEWTYYNQVLGAIHPSKTSESINNSKSFQAMFCIDDRECSLRRYIEKNDPNCETFGTPGFFNVEFYFQPENGKYYTKLCPAPVNPKYLIKEYGTKGVKYKDIHFTKKSHSLFKGWLTSQTIGFESAFQLFLTIFRPSMSPATASSFKHMDKISELTIENKDLSTIENALQVGFTIEEMATRVEGLLKSIGLIENFAPIVYVIGHGSSTVNNPHYAAYDCGACCGRPGSVNARVICDMANRKEVRAILSTRGIQLPENTEFIGGIHDTTRDDIEFFDEKKLSKENYQLHLKNTLSFQQALNNNAKERSRRFDSIDTTLNSDKIHEQIQVRSVSLFEPRPEYNHATNALCIVGLRELSKNLFLDRRSFMNSYNYKTDPDGKYLLNILKAVAPVCGGINLEYYFSRVDNPKLGAGTKLPHNVMGLFGVANGTDGDLRSGLPSQMVEIHDPIRLLVVVEQFPNIILDVLQQHKETYQWFANEWIHLISVNPTNHQLYKFSNGKFETYTPSINNIPTTSDVLSLIENSNSQENIPVHIIK